MLKVTVVFTAIMAIIVMCQLTAFVVSADVPPAEQQKYVQGLDNPANIQPTAYGNSIVAVNYDISYDGNTCFRWLNEWLPIVISNPTAITFTTPVDDFDLVHVIACESTTALVVTSISVSVS